MKTDLINCLVNIIKLIKCKKDTTLPLNIFVSKI